MRRNINNEVLNWKSRIYINRRVELKNLKVVKNRLKELITKYINPLLWGISKIEYHKTKQSLIVIIIGSNKALNRIKQILTLVRSNRGEGAKIEGKDSENKVRKEGESLLTKFINYTPKGLRSCDENNFEIILQELPYYFVDPILLARTIAGKRNNGGYENNFEKELITLVSERSLNVNGIRIEIKGITGKMTMSKKIIKTFGTLKFNSSDSIIDIGEARNFNKKGIIGVKVWISYNQVHKGPIEKLK